MTVLFGCALKTGSGKFLLSITNELALKISKSNFRLFDSFDICLLPDTLSEKRNGPAFRNEKAVGGVFDSSHEIRARMSVSEKSNVYCQLLLDCNPQDQVGFKGL